ncbi:MAG: glycosyltransferase [Alphaproteobacteria bacterium]|nr:glycosyltransferase [Alphaproteobacteria bacterium]
MKILVISHVFSPNIVGGAEACAYNFARGLSAKGHEVSVLTIAEPEEKETWDEISPEGFRIIRLRIPRAFTPYAASKGKISPTRLQWKIWNLQDYIDPRGPKMIKKVLSIVRPDHIDIHSLTGFGFNSLPAMRGYSVTWYLHDPALACTQGIMFRKGKACSGQCRMCAIVSHVRSKFMNKLKRLAFLSPSRSNLERVQKYIEAARKSPGFVVPNVPDPLPPDLPSYRPDPDGALRILFVGRLIPAKGLECVLAALEQLADQYKFTLTILGEGSEEDKLKARYGRYAWARFEGFVSQDMVSRAVATHDLVCTPSLWPEPYGRVTAQALQLGTPVFGSDHGGTAELVRHEETGLLLPAGNVEAWKNAFLRILTSPHELSAWRENAGKYMSAFDQNAILAQYESAVQSTASGA